MLINNKWLLLQMFADGGDGGSGTGGAGSEAAATGVSAADAGQQRLRELGVPENRIRKNRAYRIPTQPEQKATAAAEDGNAQQAAAADGNPPAEEPKQTAPRMTWEEIAKDPEYQKNIQAMMQQRVQKSKAAEDALAILTPALEMLAKKDGQDPGKIDYKALAKSLMDDSSLYADKALELDVPDEVAKTIVQQEAEINRYRRQEEANLQQRQAAAHFAQLEQQAFGLKSKFPGFDLKAELKNPAFAWATQPGSPITMEQAYYSIHKDEIEAAQAQVIASKTAQQISNSVQANARRPSENGSGQAPSVTTFDYSKASKAERQALKRQIYAAEARGEKIYPNR